MKKISRKRSHGENNQKAASRQQTSIPAMIHENNGKEKEDMRRHLNFLAMVHQQILTQDGIGGPT